jgi:predicted TIM-barrel fold metal-dependent hydrolase
MILDKIDLLKRIIEYKNEQEYINQLYEEVTSKTWWSDNSITNNTERQKYLYELFIEYYDIISNDQIISIADKEKIKFWLIDKCRNQLEKELERVRN